MDNIEQLYIQDKVKGDKLSAVEFNKVPTKINEIIAWLNAFDEHTRQLIVEAISPYNNIRVMTTQEYLAQSTWDTRVIYACVDNGELTSVNLGLFTIATKQGQAIVKGFPYSLPIVL